MKCVFLFCILSFCALRTAFSNEESDRLNMKLNNLEIKATKQINDMKNSTLAKIRNDVNIAKAKGIDAEICYERSVPIIGIFVDFGISQLKDCRREALAAKSVQHAISCNDKAVSTFRNNNQMMRPAAISCIASIAGL